MLQDAKIAPTLPVTDLERARRFYRDALGLRLKEELEEGLLFEAAPGNILLVYQRTTASKADNTACAFEVADLEAAMRSLRGKGVAFEEYDLPGLKTVKGVATLGDGLSAWFKDPDGNILAVVQRSS